MVVTGGTWSVAYLVIKAAPGKFVVVSMTEEESDTTMGLHMKSLQGQIITNPPVPKSHHLHMGAKTEN